MIDALYAASNILRIYAVYVLLNTIFGGSKHKKYYEIAFYAGYFLINTIVHLFFESLVLNLSTNILPLLLITYQYKKVTVVSSVFSVFSICATGMFFDLLAFSIFPESFLVNAGVVQCIAFLVFVFIFRTLYKTRGTSIYKSKHIWLLSIISFGTIAIGQFTISEFNLKSFIIANVLLIINFLNFYMYDKILENAKNQQTYKLVEASNKAYQNQLNIINENQKKVRLLKHDINNHFYKIKKYADNHDFNKLVSYLNSVENYINIENEYVNTGNADIDCLFNYKLAQAADMGVKFFCDIALPNKLIVTSFDLTVILGNILDNSLNALRNIDNKTLVIDISYSKGIIKISTENTFNPSQKNESREGEHGLGLVSVRQALEKYHGVLKTSSDDNKFYTSISLYNSLV